MPTSPPLDAFHPLVADWFRRRVGEPTPVQAETWAHLEAGRHVLALAPTGSGKTLAAFLHAIAGLVSGTWPGEGSLSVLYVSPLKALNEDVRRNLEVPLGEIKATFGAAGLPVPEARVETRSGDSPAAQRRRFLARPPAILCTTPESLAILLDSPRARPVLAGVRLLVLDEVHAVAGTKRGALLAASVGRLALLAGEFQRVALSATLADPEAVAAYVGGYRLVGRAGASPSYLPRPVTLVAPPMEKRLDFRIEWPESAPRVTLPGASPEADPEGSRYDAVVPAILGRLAAARSILVFTDSRRRAERLAYLLNEAAGPGTAWAHHGSLAKEARLVVEERFKAGELRCVVATASLELGIDIGTVDEVILAGSPPLVATALQRAGRSGHGVGAESRALLLPFHGMDLLRAAALVPAALAREVEPLHLPSCPLDVLAQVLLALAAEGPWDRDALYDTARAFSPFASLGRPAFDAVLAMLAGRFAPAGGFGARLRELEPKLLLDAASGQVGGKEGLRLLLTTAGGAIPDRGHYSLRVSGSAVRIGELDEEFVYERKVGDAFTLGTQSWRIVAIGDEAVEVAPLGQGADFIPFWKAEGRYRSPLLSARLLGLLDRLGALLRRGEEEARAEALALLRGECRCDEAASRVALGFLSSQLASMGEAAWALPGASTLAVELNLDPSRSRESHCLILHTERGGGINEPLGLALASAIEEAGGLAPEVVSDDDFILLILPAADRAEPEALARHVADLLTRLGPRDRLDSLVRRRLMATGLFGAQFREAAGTALLLPRAGLGRRSPLWLTRLKARRLFDAVGREEGFPLTAEAWRSCLEDLFDLEGLADLVRDLGAGRVRVGTFVTRTPSAFAREALWRETGEYLYRGDAMADLATRGPTDAAMAALLSSSRLRPSLPEGLLVEFAQRAARLVPGWGPSGSAEFAEWVKEAVFVPEDEVAALLAAGEAGLAAELAADPSAGGRVGRLRLPGAGLDLLVHQERRADLEAEPLALVPEWLHHQGAVPLTRLVALLGIPEAGLLSCLEAFEAEGLLVVDTFLPGSPDLAVLDAENLEILLRLARKARRPSILPKPVEAAFALVAGIQGLVHVPVSALPPAGPSDSSRSPPRPRADLLDAALEGLSGLGLPLALWETEVLPLRVPGYAPSLLDEAFETGTWAWFGTGREEVALARPEALELFLGLDSPDGPSDLLDPEAPPRDFWSLRESSARSLPDLVDALWAEAWAGRIATRDFRSLRTGLQGRFGKEFKDLEAPGPEARPGPFGRPARVPRALARAWQRGAPVPGAWYSLELPPEEVDELGRLEVDAARVRALARRYGLLCRALLERESPNLRWGRLFPALRLLELQGDLVFGRFFEGIDGPQFMSPEAFEVWRDLGAPPAAGPSEALWLSVLDPAAPALYLQAPPAGLDFPARALGNRVCALGSRYAASLTKSGRELRLASGLGSSDLEAVYRGLVRLRASLGRKLDLGHIDGQAASGHPSAALAVALGFETDRGRLVLW